MALAVVRSKVVVLLLLIQCLLLRKLFVGFYVSSFFFVIQYFVSFLFCNHLDGEEAAVSFNFIVFLMSCDR